MINNSFKKNNFIFLITFLVFITLSSNVNVFASENHILNNLPQIETRTTSKYIASYYVVYNAKKGHMLLPPNYYYYNDGQFRGSLTLYKWYDEKETTGLFKCYYRGTVYNGPAPGAKLLIPETALSN